MATKMYICLKCGEVFDEHNMGYHSEWIGESRYSSSNSGWYTTAGCPQCGTDEIEEAQDCMECTEYFAESELNHFLAEVQYGRTLDDYEHVRLCDDCLAKIKQRIANGVDEYGIADEVEGE